MVTPEAIEASKAGQIVGNIIEEQLISKLVESTLETPNDSLEESLDLPGEQKRRVDPLETKGVDISQEQQGLAHGPGLTKEADWGGVVVQTSIWVKPLPLAPQHGVAWVSIWGSSGGGWGPRGPPSS